MTKWEKVYETYDGKDTGRWQWMTVERGYRVFYPDFWLIPTTICPPPGVGLAITERKNGKADHP